MSSRYILFTQTSVTNLQCKTKPLLSLNSSWFLSYFFSVYKLLMWQAIHNLIGSTGNTAEGCTDDSGWVLLFCPNDRMHAPLVGTALAAQ